MNRYCSPSGAPGMVSTAVAHLVTGPQRTGRVVAASKSAVYLSTGDAATPAMALVTEDAIRVPNGIVLSARAEDSPFVWLRPKMEATMGDGNVRLGSLRVVPGRVWAPCRISTFKRPHVLQRAFELGALVDRYALPTVPELRAPLSSLESGLRDLDRDRIWEAGGRMLGLGPGLTPSGDDILCGLLLSCRALAAVDSAMDVVIETLVDIVNGQALARTTLASAALLSHAARDECIPQLAALFEVLDAGVELTRPLTNLLAVGHHSGSDLARGVALGLLTGHAHRTQGVRFLSCHSH